MQSLGHGPLDATRTGRRAGALVGLAVVGALAVFAVSGSAGAQSSGRATTVTVRLRDFKYHASPAVVPAGTITFKVVNAGPSTHEFNVDRTALPDGSLPLRADGLTVNEQSPLVDNVGSISTVDDGQTASLTLRLTPGHYVLFCNLEGHYLGGMHVSLTVR